MANTTNFGWETPDDTDLVKDGAAAIRTLGQAIDTSMQDLEGGTTGQILSKNSNADMDFVWVTNDVGDITEVVAGTGLSGGGSSGSVTLTNTVATEFDAKGDLVVGTGADTFDKLSAGTNETRLVAASGETTGLKYVADTTNYAIAAKGDLLVGTAADTLAALTVGTNGHTLVADSAEATGLKWAAPAGGGGMTLINHQTFSAVSSTSLNDVFSTTYNNYKIIFQVSAQATAACDYSFRLRVSGTDASGSNYFKGGFANYFNSGSLIVTNQNAVTSLNLSQGVVATDAAFANSIDVFSPFLAQKTLMQGLVLGENATYAFGGAFGGAHSQSISYTGFTILASAGTMTGTVSVYGYNK